MRIETRERFELPPCSFYYFYFSFLAQNSCVCGLQVRVKLSSNNKLKGEKILNSRVHAPFFTQRRQHRDWTVTGSQF